MIQTLFFALLMAAFAAGASLYFVSATENIDPLKFMMGATGYDSMHTLNQKKKSEDMMKLTESQQRARDLLQETRQKQEDAKQRLDDKLRQQAIIQQRIADQQQRMRDAQHQ